MTASVVHDSSPDTHPAVADPDRVHDSSPDTSSDPAGGHDSPPDTDWSCKRIGELRRL